MYEQEDPYAVGNNGKGILLGHYFIAVQEVAGPIHALHHQSSPVLIAVESEPRTTRPLKSEVPQNYCPILFVESVLYVNKE